MCSRSLRIPVAVLGATGAVGQILVHRLAAHPWFDLRAVAASDRSQGLSYRQARRGTVGSIPDAVLDRVVDPCRPDVLQVPLVFSALDAEAAETIEPCFAAAGVIVVSNARAFRLAPDVPLVVPEVNPDHLEVLPAQCRQRGWTGAIVTNPNCAATVVALALAPLHARFGIRRVSVTTLQAISGAGHPGIAAWDIIGNIVPHIAGEAEKLEQETPKLLGARNNGAILPADFRIGAQVTRVPVANGHTACLGVDFTDPPTPEAARACLREWRGEIADLELPSAPEDPLDVLDARDGPQPGRDLDPGGMRVAVGQVRTDGVFDLRLVALGDNLVRGAAGAAILNAELLVARGMI